ncbi:hypothetical protein [Actinoplanes sp. L3-i22]|uniref:hypothetical protein n=1 Tax=Actinoplanes sp. L3-i22 TaxID=2836373 RepID=UPI001C84EC8E|nr:hypothetical protein [Actinoplanes sp. L3-i22]
MTKPRLTIDGHDVVVHDWGQQYYELIPGGPHHLEIFVPYMFPRRVGRAKLDFMVPEEGVALEYMAPSFTFAKGNLGAPGQQKSAAQKSVWAFSIGFVALVLIANVILRLHS